jgi:CBS domain-containing protein
VVIASDCADICPLSNRDPSAVAIPRIDQRRRARRDHPGDGFLQHNIHVGDQRMRAHQIMTHKVITTTTDTPIVDAANVMLENHISWRITSVDFP